MTKTTKVLNIKTGKLENCTVGVGCQRHAHNLNGHSNKEVSSVITNINHITEAYKEFHAGNTYGGLLKEVPVTMRDNGDVRDVVVVNMQLGGDAIGLDEGDHTFVAVDKEEVKYMDRDKITAAFGYALFKNQFTANSQVYLNYTLYGTSGDQNIYKVERLDF